jgi:gluconolactonase
MTNPIDDFYITKEQLSFVGEDLYRPECILATKDGTLWSSDARGGVVEISPNGTQKLIAKSTSSLTRNQIINGNDLPNGMSFSNNGDIFIANFGKNCLEVIDLLGNRSTLHSEIDGLPIGKVNFVLRDTQDRLWITVSTKHTNWIDVMRPDIKDGYIALIEGNNIKIVADGFSVTNEIRLSENEEYLYIAETCGRRINRMKVKPDGSLENRETYGPSDLGSAGFPDGITFDSYGNLWGTLVFGEKIFAITPKGDLKIIFDDGNDECRKDIDAAFFNCALTEDIMLSGLSTVAPIMTSITFGGSDLRSVYIGSVLGTTLPSFKSPVAGKAPIWWNTDTNK